MSSENSVITSLVLAVLHAEVTKVQLLGDKAPTASPYTPAVSP